MENILYKNFFMSSNPVTTISSHIPDRKLGHHATFQLFGWKKKTVEMQQEHAQLHIVSFI